MDELIETIKNIAYLIIIFNILDKTIITKNCKDVTHFVTGLILVMILIEPIFSNINKIDGDNLEKKIDSILDLKLERTNKNIIEKNNEKAASYIQEIFEIGK